MSDAGTSRGEARAARHRHVVLESNDLVLRGTGDIIIFVAGKGLEPAVIGQVLEALVAQAEWNRRAHG